MTTASARTPAVVRLLVAVVALLSVVALALGVLLVRGATGSTATTGGAVPAPLAAARAGLDRAAELLAGAATSTDPAGDDGVFGAVAALPCTLSGSAAGAAWTVSVAYFDVDPSGLGAAERAEHAVACLPGGTGTARAPAAAVVTSTGSPQDDPTAASARTLEAQYSFALGDAAVAGGTLWTFGASACLAAERLAAGALVRYVDAADCDGRPEQTWTYTSASQLSPTATTATTALCATSPDATTGGTVVLEACAPGRATQAWSFEGGSRFRGQDAANVDYGTTCLWSGRTGGDLAGAVLQAGAQGCTSSDEDWGSFAPAPGTGAGAASQATGQLVNRLQAGRCADVTDQDPAADHEIVYPCKQDPSTTGGRLAWNQRWSYAEASAAAPVTAPGPVTVAVDGDAARTACLTATGTDPAATDRVVFAACADGEAAQRFVRTGDLGGQGGWTLTDAWGRCLSLGAPAEGEQWASVVLAPCTGGLEQQWSAPPAQEVTSVALVREREVTA